HLLDDAGLPLVRGREVELRRTDLDAELGERVLRLLDRKRRLHPGLGRDAADAQTGTAELGRLIDADALCAQLCGANRGCVAARAPSENRDVAVHGRDPIDRAAAARAPPRPTEARRG